jgi:hypothetical protein
MGGKEDKMRHMHMDLSNRREEFHVADAAEVSTCCRGVKPKPQLRDALVN